ncbi:MAG: hypothetical protein DMF97_01110 [Acidobacteria bacterium]|nr:MAG: hypothetical protein DMF97_01110 [Acidobacteriota bacterium]
MRKAAVLAGACIIALAVPSPASAWGYVAHRLITNRAIDLLPAELKPFFTKYRDEIVARSIDPDLWRTAGWEDDPHHFMNFGVREYGDYPFSELPHDYGAAIEKFGMATLRRNGLLPWREAEEFGNLRRAFEAFKRSPAYGPYDVILLAAAAAHYIQDAHQPSHATTNYDGQLTGNRGIHARFERDLVERFEARLTISPVPPRPITNARDFAFDALLASYRLVDSILTADTDALAGKDLYDDDYFEKFFAKVRPVLERRLAESITATAGLIMGAWEQAGRPELPGGGGAPAAMRRRGVPNAAAALGCRRWGAGASGIKVGRVGQVGRGGQGGQGGRPTRPPMIG